MDLVGECRFYSGDSGKPLEYLAWIMPCQVCVPEQLLCNSSIGAMEARAWVQNTLMMDAGVAETQQRS